MQLSVLDRLADEQQPVQRPTDNRIFDFGGPLAAGLNAACDEIVSKNRQVVEADTRPPANSFALLCLELERAYLEEVEKAMNPHDEGKPENDVLNRVMSQLKIGG